METFIVSHKIQSLGRRNQKVTLFKKKNESKHLKSKLARVPR